MPGVEARERERERPGMPVVEAGEGGGERPGMPGVEAGGDWCAGPDGEPAGRFPSAMRAGA